jgi:hypothetical protein
MVYIEHEARKSGQQTEGEMSNGDATIGESGGNDVVRLKVEGATAAVNTLRDQHTARGMSLVCPFPALEVDIPVRFGKAEDSMAQGTIHRIGVEDDPESGLPRLRLSVRVRETRSTVIATPSKSLLDEASRATHAPDANAQTDLDILSGAEFEVIRLEDVVEESSLELGEVRTEDGAARTIPIAPPPLPAAAEPAWVGCGEIALPAHLGDRERTRRRRRLGSFAAWAFIFGLAAGGVYVLGRAKVVDFGSVRSAIAGFDLSGAPNEDPARLEPIAFVESTAPASVSAVASDAAGAATGWETHVEAVADPAVEPSATVPESELAASEPEPAEAAPSEAPSPPIEALVATAAPAGEEDTITLPTRWPAEYASAYRLRNPNGVVVDVPGALVAREGWLDIGDDHPMVHAIKAMQRETGARFVVYVNGELPRFITAPKSNGIALKLVRDAATLAGQTQEVAALQK